MGKGEGSSCSDSKHSTGPRPPSRKAAVDMPPPNSPPDRSRLVKLLIDSVWLLGVTGVAYLAMAPLAYWFGERVGLQAAALAAGACLVGAQFGLLNTVLFPGLDPGLGILLGMLPRMGVPLLVGLLVFRRAEHLVKAGFFYYVIVFYLVTLAMETWLAVATGEVRNRRNSGSETGKT